jgi:hypothetical protein
LEDLPPSAKKCAESFISESLVVDWINFFVAVSKKLR